MFPEISREEYRALRGEPRRYNNQRANLDGRTSCQAEDRWGSILVGTRSARNCERFGGVSCDGS